MLIHMRSPIKCWVSIIKIIRKFPFQFDANFMKKIPQGAEASNVLVGEMDVIKKPVTAFVRLENASLLGDLTEVPVASRFIFLMLGPPGTPGRYMEVGRAIGTLMSDEVMLSILCSKAGLTN